MELSDGARIARVTSCVKAFWLIFQYSLNCKEYFHLEGNFEEELNIHEYIQGLMDDFQTLCGAEDPVVALRASCIRALAVQGLLSPNLLVPPNSRTTARPPFPVYLLPIYKFLFPNDTHTVRLFSDFSPPPASPTWADYPDYDTQEVEAAEDENIYQANMSAARPMWDNLLRDKPLVNLTTLGQTILKREHAPPSTLSFCWEALDVLLSQIRTSRFEDRTGAQIDFDDLHKNTRAYVHGKELGFRIRPLLDILDTVARRQWLFTVFPPDTRYYNRVDLVFGKKDFRNGDLLEAFAHCLPDFIQKPPTVECMSFMEKVVSQDNLWANLWDTQRSDIPIPEKLRTFEDSCAVLDLALSVLEDSQNVGWRSPEFGSLALHFESSQGSLIQETSMGRANSFRIGIIKARFCKALLAQFWDDLDREGTISFRSRWDVALLVRLIHILGLWDKNDADFWNYNAYCVGGESRDYIGAEFPAEAGSKAREMIYRTKCDGPLLILRFLGDLVAKAVPLKQSGLESEDIEKVWKLQDKVLEKRRLPLDRASGAAWEALDQLQKQVNDLCIKNKDEDTTDRKILLHLRGMIDDVNKLRIPEGPGQREPAEEQGPNTSVAADPTSSSAREERGISNFVSESSAVPGGPSSDTQTGESEDGFGRTSSSVL